MLVLCTLHLALMASGCGFEPMYGQQSSPKLSAQLLAGVAVEPVRGVNRRVAQQFKADLEDQLNPGGAVPPDPAYRLSVSLALSKSAIGIARDGTVSRYNLYLNSHYTFYRNADSAVLATGSISHVSSYNNITNEYFSTYVSEQDAISRGVTELSEMYRTRLAAELTDERAPDPAQPTVPPPPPGGFYDRPVWGSGTGTGFE